MVMGTGWCDQLFGVGKTNIMEVCAASKIADEVLHPDGAHR
jgi:hypothetical protein